MTATQPAFDNAVVHAIVDSVVRQYAARTAAPSMHQRFSDVVGRVRQHQRPAEPAPVAPKRRPKKSLEERQAEMRARMAATLPDRPAPATSVVHPATEPHFSPTEIAALWGIDRHAVVEIFKDEDGVLPLDRPATKIKRGYCSLRIPKSVLQRVHERRQQDKKLRDASKKKKR